MISALLTTTLLWVAGLLVYYLLLRSVPAHGFNRAYLLTVAVGVAMVPWLPRPEVAEVVLPALPATSAVWLSEVTVGAEAAASGSAAALLIYGYVLGLVGALAFLLRDVLRVRRCFGESRPVPEARAGGLQVRELAGATSPFGFGRTLFVRDWDELDVVTSESVVRHEGTHWRLGHRFDNFLMAGLCAVAWFHPLVYVLRRELRLVHEFQADRAALTGAEPGPYRRLLLAARFQTTTPYLATALGHEPLKARFDMMTKRFYPRQAWRLAAAALLMVSVTVACTKEEIDAELLDDLADAQAEDLSAEERFTMGLGGSHSKVATDTIVIFNADTGAETVEVIYRLRDADGADVGTFREYSGSSSMREVVRGQPVYKFAEEMPHFDGEGCAPGDDACHERSLLGFVYSNIRYPQADRDAGVGGKVIASFVVGTDGAILEPEIVRGPSESLNAEVLRLLGEMPEWAPGRQDGKLVQTRFVLPVQFELE